MQEKRVLVVGGASGIGLAVAKMACSNGARVIIGSRGAEKKRPELEARIGGHVEVVSMDITDEKQTRDALARIGEIDHLVVTVRPDGGSSPFAVLEIAQAKKSFETKFWGPLQLVQKAHKQIRAGGSIVMTSGIAGEKIYPGASVMAAINSATEALCKTLAVELSPIRINAISPGFVRPKPKETEEFVKRFPIKTLGEPEDVAQSYIYLMTHPYTTGLVLVVDGGARLV